MVFVCACLIQHIVACCSGTRYVVKKFHCVCVCVLLWFHCLLFFLFMFRI